MRVLLYFLICASLRAHIIVVEALYKIIYFYYKTPLPPLSPVPNKLREVTVNVNANIPSTEEKEISRKKVTLHRWHMYV